MKNAVSLLLVMTMMAAVFISGCVTEDGSNGGDLDACPYECCMGGQYQTKACPNGYECQDSVCVKVGDNGQNGNGGETIPAQVTFFEEEDGEAIDPSWSPDGSRIIFCLKEGSGNSKLYLVNADGSGLTEIGPGFDPSWSPVEDKIAYELGKQIYVMNPDGGNIAQLTTEQSNGQPAWKPDGTKIAYAHYGDDEPSIWIMNADGSGKTQLTAPTNGGCTFPSFSYDGSKIVYVKGYIWDTVSEKLPKSPNEIWVMNSDGSNKHQIYAPSDTYQWIFQQAWNDNGEILFATSPLQEKKIPEIGIINSDGSNFRYVFAPPKNSLGMPECIYLDPVWDNAGAKVVAVKRVIDGPQNVVIFPWEG